MASRLAIKFSLSSFIDTLRPRQNGRHFADDILKYIFLNENAWIPIEISLKFVPKIPIDNIPALVYIMAWRRPGDKPLSEPMVVRLPTHICVTRPQWVKGRRNSTSFGMHRSQKYYTLSQPQCVKSRNVQNTAQHLVWNHAMVFIMFN